MKGERRRCADRRMLGLRRAMPQLATALSPRRGTGSNGENWSVVHRSDPGV